MLAHGASRGKCRKRIKPRRGDRVQGIGRLCRSFQGLFQVRPYPTTYAVTILFRHSEA